MVSRGVATESSPRLRSYRIPLALVALAGDLALTATQVAPIALPIAIGVLFINVELYYWAGAAAIVLFAWLLRPRFRFEGSEVAFADAPRLYEQLAELRGRLRVPGRMRIYVDGSFNASATETGGALGLFGTQFALTLGIPLLMTLTREQVAAVMAHELGHFSRRHGRLGHWVYRARVGWLRYAEQVAESDSPFDRAAAWYAKHFAPAFSRWSFRYSRQCEYEADGDAAWAAGARSVAEALTRIAVIARLWDVRLPREVAAWQLQSPVTPDNFHERFAMAIRTSSRSELDALLEAELRAPSTTFDTHPSLCERLRALQEKPLLAEAGTPAGEFLFGENWPKVLAQFNERWRNAAQPDWVHEHLLLKHIAQPLLAADDADAAAWSADRRLARAKALRAVDPAAGMAALRALYEADGAARQVRFAYAAALLSENDADGVELMEELAREDAAFRVEAFSRVLSYYERQGATKQMERWAAWLRRASGDLAEAVADFLRAVQNGQARPSTLPSAQRTVVSEAVRLDPCIEDTWLLEGTGQLRFSSERPPARITLHVLAVAIDPNEAERLGEDEGTIAARYERLARRLVPPDEVPVVRTYFTTEPIPPIYTPASRQTSPSIS
jgi:Zn-dependent protease with chaperone function